jgi:hypothetical protein
MRVTKLIREYVEDRVSAAYNAKENPYAWQAELDQKKLEDLQSLLHKQQKEFLDAILKELELFNYWNNEPVEHIPTRCPSITSYKTTAMRQKDEWDRENARLKKAKIRDIMLALELGASRKELEDMLAELLTDL